MESHERIGKRLDLAVRKLARLGVELREKEVKLRELMQEEARLAQEEARLAEEEAQILLRCADADASPQG
jgi:hypothetical protein